MRKIINAYMLTWLFLLMTGGTAMAQDDFNPDNPPEPSALNRIRVVSSPEDAGYVSGAGQYTAGTEVVIRTSLQTMNYKFLHWLKNGVVCSEEMEFTYTVEDGITTFTAVFEYNPENPAEPTLINERRIFLESNMADACSFNRTSGEKATVGDQVRIQAYANQGFAFQGWYRGTEKVSENNPFYYTMPDENVTLTAHYVYDPDSPGDPQGSQDDVDNPVQGDVNRDGELSIVDITALVEILKGNDSTEPYKYNHSAADVNNDGTINEDDVTTLVNIILTK